MEAMRQAAEFIRTHNVFISEAIRQVLFTMLAFEFVIWTSSQQQTVLQMVSALLAIFTAKQTVSATRIEVIKDKARDEGYRIGTGDGSMPPPSDAGTGTGSGTLPPAA